MDNSVFKKRIKIGSAIFALIVVVLTIVWPNVPNDNNCINKNKSSRESDCINNDNYAKLLTFEEALKKLYVLYNIQEDPRKYISYHETLEMYYDVDEWHFLSIDNYRQFLSDDAKCNRGKEPLKSFICKIKSDESFLKSRIMLDTKETNIDFSSNSLFKFYYEITDREYNYGWVEAAIASWIDLDENNARYAITAGMTIYESYTFSRENGKWYLTDHMINDFE